MRSALVAAAQKRAGRARKGSLSAVPPASTSNDFDPDLAGIAASILYPSPLPSPAGRPIFILNAAAFPDSTEVDYDHLLSYVLARLPEEDELLSGQEYEIVFFAGGPMDGATAEKKQGPGMGWYLQAYHVLSRATRKKLQRLYIVHPRTWVRVLLGVFGTVVSPKFRRKIVHDNTLTGLAEAIPIQNLLIPPAVYLHDRKLQPEIYVQGASGRRAFGARHPFPKNLDTGKTRLPRVLRETTTFILMPANIKTEGVFRIPPHATLQGVLKEAYDRGQQYIIWKELGATYAPPYVSPSVVDEVRLEDAYGVHLAASLVKQWYRELREPIFPESCYDFLRSAYSAPDTEITHQDLVNLLSPQSDGSPLTNISRQILSRHLLPLLSRIVAYEDDNKMGATNLAICFSMCLVCGSNQLEDAQVSGIVKRILAVAIPAWPQLRHRMPVSEADFEEDLRPPQDSRDYEDLLDEEQRKRLSGTDPLEGHRIEMEDSETSSPPKWAPKLPLRPLSLVKDTSSKTPEPTPSLPERPQKAAEFTQVPPTALGPSPIVPNRKPAPAIVEPPRYSSVFDSDGNSIHVADSPSSYVPVDGFGPPRRSNWSLYGDEKRPLQSRSYPEPTIQPAPVSVPKRKAVSGDKSVNAGSRTSSPPEASLQRSAEDSSAANLAAQRGAATLAMQAAAAARSNGINNGQTESPSDTEIRVTGSASSEVSSNENESVFRKPSWPASARPQTLTRPVQPRQSQPLQSVPPASLASVTSANMPRPRTPSPGLLKRMSSMEGMRNESEVAAATQPSKSQNLEPRPLNLTRSSVDDLRRLYEERANTAQSLARAGLMRKTSV